MICGSRKDLPAIHQNGGKVFFVIVKAPVSRRELVYESPFGTHRLPLDEIVAVMLID